MLKEVFGDIALARASIFECREEVEDDEHPDGPAIARTNAKSKKNIAIVRKKRLGIWILADIVTTNRETV